MLLNPLEEIARKLDEYNKRLSHLERLENSFIKAEYHPDRPPIGGPGSGDEFLSSTLDDSWIVFGGLVLGVIDWVEAGAVDEYDLTQQVGKIMFQTDNFGAGGIFPVGDAGIRKAFVPGAGDFSVIAKVHIPDNNITGTSNFFGIGLTDDLIPTNALTLRAGMRAASAQMAVFGDFAGSPLIIPRTSPTEPLRFYFAIIRDGATIREFVSIDGYNWRTMGTAVDITVNHLWIGIEQSAASTPRPVYICDWIRTFASATLTCGENP